MPSASTPRLLAVTMIIALARLAPAAAPAAPAWGRIDDAAAGLGRHAFVVERWPADGRLTVPAGFPQIIRAAADAGDLLVEYNADATAVAVLAADTGRPTVIEIETAEETRQFDDGRIVLTARSALVDGTRAKLESHPGNHRIGFWSNPADSVSWTWKPTRWGAYDARLVYSTASPSGSEIAVAIGDATLPGRLESTGSWYRYTTLPLGRVVIPSTGDLAVRVRCTKPVGGAVMNLKAIVLTPTCEGTPPKQAADGSTLLHARDATIRGTTLRWEPAEKKQTLGYWMRPTDAAEWTFSIDAPGAFDVEVLQGCGTGQGGSGMAIDVDRGRPHASSLAFTVEDSGGFQAFKTRIVGRVTLEAAGEHLLHVQPRTIAKTAACDIRQIRLVPVAP